MQFTRKVNGEDIIVLFQSPRSGKFESNRASYSTPNLPSSFAFQSPRSGKFESNYIKLIHKTEIGESFNPLDRGNLNQMMNKLQRFQKSLRLFQSPRSGKFESNGLLCKLVKFAFTFVSIP